VSCIIKVRGVIKVSKADILNSITKTSTYKKGKPVTQEQYIEAVDNLFNKKFPIIPDTRKGKTTGKKK